MKTLVKEDEECPIYIWDKQEAVQLEVPMVVEVRPVELHVLPTGSIHDQPSLVFLLQVPGAPVSFITQISLEKLWPAIEAAIKAKGPLM